MSIINLKTKEVENIDANKSPLGIKFHGIYNKIIVSNWYDDTITIIDQEKKDKKIIKVGKSPAGIDIHPKTGQIVIANRDSNTVTIIEDLNKKIINTIKVQKSPFGVFFSSDGKKLYVSNVQFHGISFHSCKEHSTLNELFVSSFFSCV